MGGFAIPQKEIEVILMRQLASYLAIPIFLVDMEGTLIYFNEPAEAILGRRFEEAGEMPEAEWTTVFTPRNESAAEMPPDALPLVIARSEGRPAHSRFWIMGLDNVPRYIEVTAFPLLGQADRKLGAVALFWEVEP